LESYVLDSTFQYQRVYF